MTEIQTIVDDWTTQLTERIRLADLTLQNLYAKGDTGLGAVYEPILKEKAIVPVTVKDARDIFIDLWTHEAATAEQVTYLQWLSVSIPGKNFCDASWVVEVLNKLDDPPAGLVFPPPKFGNEGDLDIAYDAGHGDTTNMVPSGPVPDDDDGGASY